jgi:hypothetical protein
MKQISVFVFFICVFVLFISCSSTGNTQKNTGHSNGNVRFLDPEEVVGKNLVGSDETGSYKFILKQDGSLEYALNDNTYYGTWSFDRKQKMYPYIFRWVENEKETGYIFNFIMGADFLEEFEIQLHGHWLYGYNPFSKKLRFEKVEIFIE